jgi:PPM family protein phosphatase
MVSALSFSEPGGHPVNEDACAVRQHPAAPDCWLCLLADGQGGRAGGARAAQLACDTALALALEHPPERLADGATWAALLGRAGAAVCADAAAGYTTLVGLCVVPGVAAGASCGDSAALLVCGGRARQLTAAQAKNPPVGSGKAPFLPFEARLAEPWAVLAMSDGVWKYAGWAAITQAALALRGRALLEALQARARLPGSGRFPDDFTLVLLEGAA